MKLAAACALAACTGDGPRLDSVEPAVAGRGGMVELVGRGLCDGDCETAAGEVQIGLSSQVVLAGVLEYEDERALVVVPDVAPIGRTQILVTVNDHASNALAFEVVP